MILHGNHQWPSLETTTGIRSESPMERIELRNILGQLVMSQNVQNTEAQVSVDRLSNGTYFVRVYRDGMSADLKLIKQ